MAALLPPRTALMARSSPLSTGGIVGVVLGVFFGVLLIALCVFPFILGARRRRQHGGLPSEEDMSEFPRPYGFMSNAPFADTLRRLSHGGTAHTAPRVSGAGSDTGDSAEKPGHAVYTAGTHIQYGLPSPAASPQDAATSPEPFPGRSVQDGRTATGSLTLGPESVRDSTPPKALSREPTMTGDPERGAGFTKQSLSDSFASPSRQVTFGSQGITAEPESFDQAGASCPTTQSSQSRKPSRHLSDSLRHFAHRASAAIRRDSTRSTGSTRDPKTRPDTLVHAETAPAILEPVFIDTEAPGLAYDYYHPSHEDMPSRPEHGASYGPPLDIPDTFAQLSTLPGAFITPTSAASIMPISPVSPIRDPQGQPSWTGPNVRATAEDGEDVVRDSMAESLRGKKGAPRPLERTSTQPLQTFVPDVSSPPLPSTEQFSVDPRSVMKPTTRSEMDFEVKQELVKLTTPSPPAVPQEAQEMLGFPSQPTPAATPDPEHEPELALEHGHGWEQEPQTLGESELLWPAPEIAIDDSRIEHSTYANTDMAMLDCEGSEPSPSPGTPSHASPYHTPYSLPTPDFQPLPQLGTPYLGTLSPASNTGSSSQADGSRTEGYPSSERAGHSPGQFACHECDRVFDQLHKLHHHTRYHDRPHKCVYQNCDQRFGTKTHLDRHVNDKHLNTKRFYCFYPNCAYGPRGKGFPRKDNWKRHMLNKHNNPNPPEPQAVDCSDEIMGGQ